MAENKQKPVVLVVDDTLNNITLINEILKEDYRIKIATNGEKALEVASANPPDIILMDIMMPVMNGYEACRQLKLNPSLCDIPVLFLTARSDIADEQKGFALGAADYITKPISPPILMARMQTHLALKKSHDLLEHQNQFLEEEVQRRTKDLSILQETTIMAMAALAETRNFEIGSHIQRTKLYIQELASYMGLTNKYQDILHANQIKTIVLSSLLHDIGKIGIPDHILMKPGPLTHDEFEIMKQHTTLGMNAILSAENMMGSKETFLTCAREIAYYHHERWDGSGYPAGLRKEEIPLSARLMAVVDVYDAITNHRVYKDAIPHEEAVELIRKDSGKHFDPDVVEAFLALSDTFQAILLQYTNADRDNHSSA